MNRWWLMTTCLGGALLGIGCAHHGPVPNELTEARAIYARASAGPARRLAPARLSEAKMALEAAELAHLHGSPDEAEDRAYVAARRSELAEAEASTVVAGQRREVALQELSRLAGPHADRARAELAAAGKLPPSAVAASSPVASTVPGVVPTPAVSPGLQPARQVQDQAQTAPGTGLQPAGARPTEATPTPPPPALQRARATETEPVSTTPPVEHDKAGAPSEMIPPPVTLTTPAAPPENPSPPR
jgi:hypothetical protein